jgi:hypothetical protein
MDRYDQIDWVPHRAAVAPEPRVPPLAVHHGGLHIEIEDGRGGYIANGVNGMGSVVDISAGETVPRVPRRGFLITLVGYAGHDTDGIRRHEFAWTGYDGTFRLPLLCRYVFTRQHENFQMQALKLDEDRQQSSSPSVHPNRW